MITTMEVALRRPRDSAQLTETLNTCLGEARHLHALVQALLRQVRAQEQAGDDDAERRLDAAEVASQCADLSQAMAADRQVRLTRSIQTGIPVKANPARLRSVLLNLVGNAIEHNHAGGSVEIATRADNGSVEIAVSDTGPGIPAEHLPHVFQPFYRASADRETDGHLGLGLFLVESHVKAMGGECRVESTVGVGTTFRVRLPAATNQPKGEARNV
jgi:signal transduction histidine kinase